MNLFQKLLHGIESAAKYFLNIPATLPKLIRLWDDARQDGSTLIPEVTQLVGDVESIVTQGGKDAVAFLAASKLLWPAIVAAAAADGTSLSLDLAAIGEVKPLISASKNFADVVPLFEKLFADYENFHMAVQADLVQLEKDLD